MEGAVPGRSLSLEAVSRRSGLSTMVAATVVISNSCPILQQLMSNAVALRPVLPIFQVLGCGMTAALRNWLNGRPKVSLSAHD